MLKNKTLVLNPFVYIQLSYVIAQSSFLHKLHNTAKIFYMNHRRY
jgi:hypothetical protein